MVLLEVDKKKPVTRPYALDAVDRALKKLTKRTKGGLAELGGDEVANAAAAAFFKSEEAVRSLRLMKAAFEEIAATTALEKHDLPIEVMAAYKKAKGKASVELALFYVLAQAAPGSWS